MNAPTLICPAQSGTRISLRIMETTDLHMQLHPYDYYADRPLKTLGLARTASHIEALRREADNAILVDCGDFLQGNPMADYIAFERGLADGALHPAIAAMNALKYDAATLGNHDFNFGLEFLETALAGADFPFVSANMARRLGAEPTGDETLVPPYVILKRRMSDAHGKGHDLRIGLIGFLPPQTVTWDQHHLAGRVQTRDILEAARGWVPRMIEAGADIVVALSHSGIGEATHRLGMENAALPLAGLEGIDALAVGHSHLVFPAPEFAGRAGVDAEAGTLRGKPAVMAGFWGSHLGVMDLTLAHDGGRWRVVASRSGLRPIARRNRDQSVTELVPSAPEVLSATARDHAATLKYARRTIGHSRAGLHSYFAQIGHGPALSVVARAQREFVARRLAGSDAADLPVLSAVAPFKCGGRSGPGHYTDVPAGALAQRHMADLYHYPNRICAVMITGAELREWLERAAGMFNRIVPGDPEQRLLSEAHPGYNFDVIHGVSYRVDLRQPARYCAHGELCDGDARRITGLRFRGRPVTDRAKFVVATNDFRAGGGGGYAAARAGKLLLEGPERVRDVVAAHVRRQSPIMPDAGPVWQFAPLGGVAAIFETGEGAARHWREVPGLEIAPAGATDAGFRRYRLIL